MSIGVLEAHASVAPVQNLENMAAIGAQDGASFSEAKAVNEFQLKEEYPEIYNAIVESLMANILAQDKKHNERIIALMKEGRRSS